MDSFIRFCGMNSMTDGLISQPRTPCMLHDVWDALHWQTKPKIPTAEICVGALNSTSTPPEFGASASTFANSHKIFLKRPDAGGSPVTLYQGLENCWCNIAANACVFKTFSCDRQPPDAYANRCIFPDSSCLFTLLLLPSLQTLTASCTVFQTHPSAEMRQLLLLAAFLWCCQAQVYLTGVCSTWFVPDLRACRRFVTS